MEQDFYERLRNLANELFLSHTLVGMPGETLIDVLHQLANKYEISINEKDLGEQKLSENDRAWKRYQIWLNDPYSFEGGVYGKSETSMEEALRSIPSSLRYLVGVREVN